MDIKEYEAYAIRTIGDNFAHHEVGIAFHYLIELGILLARDRVHDSTRTIDNKDSTIPFAKIETIILILGD